MFVKLWISQIFNNDSICYKTLHYTTHTIWQQKLLLHTVHSSTDMLHICTGVKMFLKFCVQNNSIFKLIACMLPHAFNG